jgi:hypothetical protein
VAVTVTVTEFVLFVYYNGDISQICILDATVVFLKNAVFWDMTLCTSKNLRFGGTYYLQNVGSYKSHTRRPIPEDGILHSHRRENLKPYKL